MVTKETRIVFHGPSKSEELEIPVSHGFLNSKKEVRNIERQEILNVIENLKMKIDELSILSEERELTAKEQKEQENLIKALELMRLELPERPLTVQLQVNP